MTTAIPQVRWTWEAVAARIAAILLVGSSAGFGTLYAWGTGSQHGPALGALAVCMAIALELAKPLAVAGTFAAGWRNPFRALAYVVLAAAAIAYSLTAELSLMAGARGDVVAERAGGSQKSADARATRDRLARELAGLSVERPSAEVAADVAGRLTGRRAAAQSECQGWQPSKSDRAACIDVQRLRSEMARAQHRESLAVRLADAETVLAGQGSIRVADPAAASLAAYGAALGLQATAEALTPWLALVPVLALEIGSALAGLLAGQGRTERQARTGHGSGQEQGLPRREDSPAEVPAPLAPVASQASVPGALPVVAGQAGATDSPPSHSTRVLPVIACDPRPDNARPSARRQRTARTTTAGSGPETKLIDVLRAGGGQWSGSQRSLAASIKLERSATNQLLARMANQRLINVRATARGTSVELAN